MDGMVMLRDKIKALVKQIISFGIVGLIMTSISLVIYWLGVRFGVHYLLANAIGFVVSVAIGYVLNNVFTFRGKEKNVEWSLASLLKVYVSYFFTGIILNSALLWFWNDHVGINENLSPVLNLFVSIPLNFILNKFWVYRDRTGRGENKVVKD